MSIVQPSFKKIASIIVFNFLILTFTIQSAEPELLKLSDVNGLMKQIFQEHVDKKEMTAEIMKNAFRNYIDQFDPGRLYLLEEEVHPYFEMTQEKIQQVIDQYKYQDLSAFIQLNDLIQRSILRSREIRKEIESDKATLFASKAMKPVSANGKWSDPDLKLAFAKDSQELKERFQKQIFEFIEAEKKRFGVKQVEKNPDQVIGVLENFLRSHENSYLFENDKGQALEKPQKENLLTLHILKALASSLDAHSTFFSNAEALDIKTRLEKEFEGIGVVLEQGVDGSVIISKIIEGGPAQKSGLIQPGDKIISIDGRKVQGLSLEAVLDMIRGKNNQEIVLDMLKKAKEGVQEQEFTVKLKRAPITVNDERVKVTTETFGNGIIGIIKLDAFYQGDNGVTSENDVKNAILELEKKGNLRGLILDLRENSGGFLTQAVKVAGLFIRSGVVVISKYSNNVEHYYRDMNAQMVYSGPLVILTSRATASAAEIVAQSLQDYGVALVVGDEQTYGKGTIQTQTVTDDKASTYFKVTVGEYYTVSGKSPQIEGVKADIVVPGQFSEEHIGEKYLENALPPDHIASEYKDDLKDVNEGLKPWYLRYYIPTLQHKIEDWRSILPILKRNSEYRITNNKNYQAFLKKLKGIKEEPSADEEEQDEGKNKGNFGNADLQQAEGVNIVKDMIMLHSHAQANALKNQENDSPVGQESKE